MPERESKDKLLERIQERRAKARKKLKKRAVKVLIGLGVIAIVLAILYPTLRVFWHTRKARSDDADTRKESLKWLSDNDVKSAVPVFLQALNTASGESDIAREALMKLGDRSIIPDLLKLWKDSTAKTRGRYNALEVLSVLGDKSLMDIFIDPLAVLSDRWEFSWDFLDKHADLKTVEELTARLDSGNEREVKAAVIALGYIRKKPLVSKNQKVRKALAAKLDSPVAAIRAEAAHSLEGIAGKEELPQLIATLDDKDEVVCQYVTRAVGYMEPEVAKEALGKLVELLLHDLGNICREAADALIRIGAEPVLPRLIEIVLSGETDSYSRVSAIGVIESVPSEKSLETITAVLGDEDSLVAEAAAVSLIRIGNTDSVGPLVEALKSTKSHAVRVMTACAIGMFGEKKAAPALVAALKQGDVDVARRAGEALLRIGAREVAPELEGIVLDTDISAVARREALLVLSELRTLSSIKMSLAALVDPEIAVREEARNATIQLAGDLLSKEKVGLEAARNKLIEKAGEMYQEEMAKELVGNLKKAKTFEKMNSFVLAAQRQIDEKNKADLDALKGAMEKARGLYWTALLRDELAAAGVTQKQTAEAADALRTFVERDYWMEEIPVKDDINRVKGFIKQFGFKEDE